MPAEDTIVVSARGVARFRGRRFPCALGRGGLVSDKREGDGGTPRGVFGLETVFYRADRISRPVTRLSTQPIGPFDGWSDDPTDPQYNMAVTRPHPFNSERLARPDPLYDLIVVFDANRAPIAPGCGSALFLHVWRAPRLPTAGCIAFARQDLLWILARCSVRTRLWVSPH